MDKEDQRNRSNIDTKKQTIFLVERMFAGSMIIISIGIVAYLILFAMMCVI